MRSLQFIQRRISRANLFAAALLVAACSGDSPSDPGPQPIQYGTLVVTIGGLPTGATANVTVSGPGGFSRSITATTTLTELAAGTYSVDATEVTHEGSTYTGAPTTQTYQVAAGATVSTPAVSYALATGALSITLAGLPQATQAPITISGPNGYNRTIGAAADIVGLTPGIYSIEAREIQLPGLKYAAAQALQQVEVIASPAPTVAHVVYALASGSLQINISGLPSGTPASITVTGPGNYFHAITAETVIDNLTPGTYTITASNVVAGALYVAVPSSQQVVVEA